MGWVSREPTLLPSTHTQGIPSSSEVPVSSSEAKGPPNPRNSLWEATLGQTQPRVQDRSHFSRPWNMVELGEKAHICEPTGGKHKSEFDGTPKLVDQSRRAWLVGWNSHVPYKLPPQAEHIRQRAWGCGTIFQLVDVAVTNETQIHSNGVLKGECFACLCASSKAKPQENNCCLQGNKRPSGS